MQGCRFTLTDCIDLKMKGLLCLECALGYCGLSSFNFELNPMFFVQSSTDNNVFLDAVFGCFLVNSIDMSYTKEIADGLFVTRPERTICDLIKYNRHEFFILEALDEIYNYEKTPDYVDLQLLDKLVDEYGIRAEFDKLRQDSETFFDEE